MKKPRGIARIVLLGVVGILVLGFTLFPIYWMVMTSFKPIQEWNAYPPVWLTTNPTLDNYRAVVNPASIYGYQIAYAHQMSSVRSYFDSAITAGLGTLLSIAVGILAAFAIGRWKMGGSWLPMFILSLRMLPPVVIIVPLVILYTTVGLYDTYLGLILAYGLFTAPYSVWMIRSFIESVPVELEEAAIIEGLPRLATHFRVTLPLIKGGIAATALFLLILNWSEFLFALVLTHNTVKTIPVALSTYSSGIVGQLYGVQAALAVLAVIPVVIFAYIVHKYLVVGMTFGAVKGR